MACDMKILAIAMTLLATAGLRSIVSGDEEGGKCDMDEFDQCASTAFMFGDRQGLIPSNNEEMVQRCRIDEEAIKCWRRNMLACVKRPLTRQVTSLILRSIQRMVDLRCKDDEDYEKEYLKVVNNCILRHLEGIHSCMDEFRKNTFLSSIAESDHQLPLACCSFHQYQTCTSKLTRGSCEDSDADFVEELLEGYAGDTIGLMCTGYTPDSHECTTFKLPPFPENVTLPNSLVPLMMNILDELTNQ